MTRLPKRKQIRLKNYDYSLPGWYYITICTQDREQLFGEIMNGKMILNEFGKIINKTIQFLPKRYPPIDLDIYQLMPNHLHMIIVINPPPVRAIHESPVMIHAHVRAHHDTPLRNKRQLLSKCIGYFKMNTAKHINQLRNISGRPVWQRNYYEHIIRDEESLNKIREYIQLNPQMWKRDRNNPEKIKN